jgi:hypothetical protein
MGKTPNGLVVCREKTVERKGEKNMDTRAVRLSEFLDSLSDDQLKLLGAWLSFCRENYTNYEKEIGGTVYRQADQVIKDRKEKAEKRGEKWDLPE